MRVLKEEAMKAIGAAALTLAISAFAAGGLVPRLSQDHASPPAVQQPTLGMMQRMGSGMGSMGQMQQMTNRHQQMTERMNKLMQSMAAIEAEKDPAALKAKLAEHRALLEQMRSHMMQQDEMMQQMMGCTTEAPAAGGTQAPAAK
jgi:hypothetical protein